VTDSQLWAVLGGLMALLFVAVAVLGRIADATPRLVDQVDHWKRQAMREAAGARQWAAEAERVTRWARALEQAGGPAVVRRARDGGGSDQSPTATLPAVRTPAPEPRSGPIGRRLTGATHRPQADDSTT
jgi:hypothetical protein